MENIDIAGIVDKFVLPWGIRLLLAVAIFYVGRMVVAGVSGLVRRLLQSRGVDDILVGFLVAILRWALLLFVIIAALSQLGINTNSLVAVLGAAGLAIGLSLQSSLSNFAAGVMLIMFRPFRKGDFVEAGGATGIIEHINIFTTTMTTADNKEVIVPNGAIITGTITNYSARATRRVDMVFSVSYGDDLPRAKQLLQEILAGDARILKDPAPVVAVGALGESGVNFLVRPWTSTADYWAVLWDTTEAVKMRFAEAGLAIPYPQVDVHLNRSEK